MEISKKKSGSGENPKRNRSLDIKSLYEPRFSELEESKKKVADKNDQEGSKKKKRKSRKEVSLSCPEPDAKRSRKEKSNGVKPDLGSGQKSNHGSKELHGALLSLGDHGSSFKIPKRPRGFVGRKKLKSDQASASPKLPKPVDHAGVLKAKVIKKEGKSGSSEQLVRLSSPPTGNHGVSDSKSAAEVSDLNLKLKKKVDSKPTRSSNSSNKKSKLKLGAGVGPNNKRSVSKSLHVVEVNDSNSKSKQKANSKSTLSSKSSDVNLKPKVGADEVEEKKTGQAGSVVRVVKEYNQVVDGGDMLPNKQPSSIRKKNLVVGKDGGEPSRKRSKPFLITSDTDSCFIGSLNDDDEDEENLEENAARMLSSRFDPNCTGFSSRRKSPATETDDVQDSLSRQGKSLGAGESAPAHVKTRARRPRREDNGTGMPRKRRHFYDILATDLDPYWFLKRRIKIYWPLDECWYDGFVDDYLSETKLHHVKYDDREEEWVNLKVEKFKLLLLRSEVPDKANSGKCSTGGRDSCRGQTVQPEDDASCDEDDLDSEPIALWLASQSQRVKALPKPKRRRTSQKILSLVSSLSSEKMDNSNINVANSDKSGDKPDCESASADNLLVRGTVDKSALGSSSSSQNGKQMVYARRKSFRKKSEGGSPLCNHVNAFGSGPQGDTFPAPPTVGLPTTKDSKFSYGCIDSRKQLWIFDDKDKLRLNDVFLKSNEFSVQICLSVSPFMEFSREIGPFWLLHDIFMLKHGVVVIASRAVILEMLLIDGNHGLRFLLFEGCLKHALAFVFLILTVFSQSDEHWNGDMNLPVTCIRFQLSSVQDVRKRHVFAFYSFSGLQRSKWQNLDSKILQQCHLIQQLSVSECTYDNIKELGCGSSHQCKPRVGLELALNEGFKNKFLHAIWPLGVFSEPCNTGMSQSAFSLAAKPGEVPQFAISFPAAPTFFLTLHLQLLMERSFSWVNIRHQSEQCSIDDSENGVQPVVDCTQCRLSTIDVQDVTAEHEIRKMDKEDIAVEGLPCDKQDLGMDVVLATDAAENTSSSEKIQKRNLEDATVGCVTETATEVINQSHHSESKKEVNDQIVVSTLTTVPITSPTSNLRSDSTSGGMIVGIPDFEQVGMPFAGKRCISRHTSDLDWNVHDDVVHSPNHTVSSSSRKFGRSSSISSPLGHQSPVWSDRKPTFMQKGLSNGPKRRRTHVQYTLPYAGHDLSVKEKVPSLRSLPCKRIRKASLKRLSDGSGNNRKNLESLTCFANVLVTHGDKGWRECGAHIALEVADHNEWRLTVKVSGATKYFYKVKHILQPGSTNRYTHAMMWKGGKDWVLEFPDRSQWTLFKEMHEECYNRNIRAASVKNIPIPGVRLVEESDDYGDEFPFLRNPIKYFRQVQTDVEMAMDPSRILYDMDSDDEQWLMKKRNWNGEHKYEEITEEFLEKAIDIFEKISYAQRRGEFTDAEIEKLVTGIGSPEAAKVIYEHWRQKREKTGMPLIRHLQPPLWQRYQQQVKEWEHDVSRDNFSFSVSSQKVPAPEKPPMFAFCLRPRGLDVPNRGSKQRSHRKLSVSGHHHASSGYHNNLLDFGRRSNGHAFGDEKMLYTTSLHDSSYVSPSVQASRRALSPRDAHFSLSNAVSEWKGKPKGYKNKPKKLGSHLGFGNQQIMSYDQRTGIRQEIEPLDISDLDELRWHEASGAAQHAVSLAKLKREKAQRLFRRADSAIHNAVVALMTAEAMKDSTENSNGVG